MQTQDIDIIGLAAADLSVDDKRLRDDVRLLGNLLGETLIAQQGKGLFDLVEQVRKISKSARLQKDFDDKGLSDLLTRLSSDELFHLARAFSHFLALANIAEQHHQVRSVGDKQGTMIGESMESLIRQGTNTKIIAETVRKMRIRLVFTAHPTEITRRTIIRKYHRIANLLRAKDVPQLSTRRIDEIINELRREIVAVWETDEIRRERPTPLDEVRSGLVVIEQSIWSVLPNVLRELDQALRTHADTCLDLDAAPIRIESWIGGDRDGNPNVTSDITVKACLMARLMAAQLYWREVEDLRRDLSMHRCNDEIRELAGNAREPYRVVLMKLCDLLAATHRWLEAKLNGRPEPEEEVIKSINEIRLPLRACYQSLLDCGVGEVANGRLLDLLRRVECFGLALVRVDIRQESARHVDAIDAITRGLGIGAYAEWDESERQEFLIRELSGNRPLIPLDLSVSDEVKEVLHTCKAIAGIPAGCLGAYVISMASQPSDVLAVELLQRECGVKRPLRVVPLFERVEHLRGAADTLDRLLHVDWYRERIAGKQEVMIGYSDSAKDAGQLAAAWGLYQAQERLAAVADRCGIELTLFHGRGGTVARGGVPAMDAIHSLPPGSVSGRIRVTEQGEVVQAKYGLPEIASDTLNIYLVSVLESTVKPPPVPKKSWRDAMDSMTAVAMDSYRALVQRDPKFLDYFHTVTPEAELGKLNIGSRPARRKPGRDIAHLRAIPWIFAWTQTRLMLPAWLGAGYGLRAVADENLQRLRDMRNQWPFFATTLDAIEMVLAKTDVNIASQYDSRLVPEELQRLGEELRDRYIRVYHALLGVTQHQTPLEHEPITQRSIQVRNPYTDPLNLLQAELLARIRTGGDDMVQDALLVTVNGIAAGMRNTG